MNLQHTASEAASSANWDTRPFSYLEPQMRFELILQPYRGCVINRVDHRGTFLELLTGIEPASSPLRGELSAIGDSVAHISNYLPHLQDPQQQRSFSKTNRWLLSQVELCSHLVDLTITHQVVFLHHN